MDLMVSDNLYDPMFSPTKTHEAAGQATRVLRRRVTRCWLK